MSKEKFSPTPDNKEIYDVKTLSAQTKMRILLEVFDLGKDKEQNEKRKEHFLDLVRRYNEAVRSGKAQVDAGFEPNRKQLADAKSSNQHRANIHNEIMDIITKISLAHGAISPAQRDLTTYLAGDRKRVQEMIKSYFGGFDAGNPRQHSMLHQALRGEGLFTSPPGKENE
ncbi:MAG TPA: hypothetical protein VFK07_03425 [Candidatus Paceibacterota bacterium]|nr:hypothetical protein [Candidatus Paceibacterota bacterium]